MERMRTFKAVADAGALEPVRFTLEGATVGEDGSRGEPWEESFTCVPIPPAGMLDDLSAMAHVGADGTQIFNAPSLLSFMRGVLIDQDVERFEDLVRSKAKVVELEALGSVVIWLAEEFTGRPTPPPSS